MPGDNSSVAFALRTYKSKTKIDLASHRLLPSLQSCDSPEAILTVLREQIPVFNQSQNGDGRLTNWVTPTVNALYAFSATLRLGDGQTNASQLANEIFAGISVLLLAAEDATSLRGKLIAIFSRIEHSFLRLELYTGTTPTTAREDTNRVIKIMVEVLMILANTTMEVKSGRLRRCLKKLTGNADVDDSLERLDKLTKEAQMALLKSGPSHSYSGTKRSKRHSYGGDGGAGDGGAGNSGAGDGGGDDGAGDGSGDSGAGDGSGDSGAGDGGGDNGGAGSGGLGGGHVGSGSHGGTHGHGGKGHSGGGHDHGSKGHGSGIHSSGSHGSGHGGGGHGSSWGHSGWGHSGGGHIGGGHSGGHIGGGHIGGGHTGGGHIDGGHIGGHVGGGGW